MAAGLGFKDFTTGEVLTANDVDGYLMQGIWVFASAAARTSAVTSPQEGNMSFLKDTNSTEYYDGAAWVAVGAAGGSLTLLSTTTLSGASTTISSISQSYQHLYAYIYKVGSTAGNSGASKTRIAPNGSTGITSGIYSTAGSGWASVTSNYLMLSNESLQGSAPNNNSFALTIYNYSQTDGRKNFSSFGNGYIADTGTEYSISGMGGILTTSAITSLVFSNSAYDFNQGTVKLYGVN